MMKMTITEPQLFKNLVEVQIDDIYIDLHNDYECIQFEFEKNTDAIKLRFLGINSTQEGRQVDIIFSDVKIVKLSLPLQGGLKNPATIDNIYRGRYEKNNILYEHSSNGKAYYYVNFDEEYNAEFFSNGISLYIV